jgi:hypothetical protein
MAGLKLARLGGGMLLGATGLLATKLLFDLAVEYATLKAANPGKGGLATLWAAICNRALALVEWLSKLLTTDPAEPSASYRRQRMAEVPTPVVSVQPGHSHGESAAVRSCADQWTRNYASILGGRVYHTQLNHVQMEQDKIGKLEHITLRDRHHAEKEDPVRETDILYYRNDDYYRDMPQELNENFNVHVIYTFVPEHAALSTKEYKYTFDHYGQVHMEITDGGNYVHPLWGYGYDRIVTVPAYFWRTTYVYQVQRKTIGPDHQLVILFPDVSVSPFTRLTSFLARKFKWLPLRDEYLGMHVLERFNPIQYFRAPHVPVHPSPEDIPGFVEETMTCFARFRYQGPEGSVTTTAMCEAYASTTLATEDDSYLMQAAALNGPYYNLATAASHCPSASKTTLVPLTYYVKTGGTVKSAMQAMGPAPVLAYQYSTKAHPYVPDAKPSLHPLITPIVANDTFAPSKTPGNMHQAIWERSIKITSDAEPTAEMIKHMDEFIDQTLDYAHVRAHSMDLADLSEVEDQCKTSAQKVAFAKWAGRGDARRDRDVPATEFQKAEAYQEPKAPRGIVNIHTSEKYNSARIWLALGKVLRQQRWYGFCGIEELERRLVACFDLPGEPVDGDGSKWEGRYSLVAKYFEMRLMLRAFAVKLHELIVEEAKKTSWKLIFFDEEFWISAWHQLSGRAATAGSNGAFNAYACYHSLRTGSDDPLHGPALEPEEAFLELGIFGGDDAVLRLRKGEDGRRYVEGYARCGQLLVLGKVGMPTFLGRFYGELKQGSPNSCQNLRRALRNLSVTTSSPSGPDTNLWRRSKLIEKLAAIRLTDPNTPGLKQLADMLGTLETPAELGADASYWAVKSQTTGERFRNIMAPWMLDPDVCGFTTDEFGTYMQFISYVGVQGLLDNRFSPIIAKPVDLTSLPLDLPGNNCPKYRRPTGDVADKVTPYEVVENINNDNNKATQEESMRACSVCKIVQSTTTGFSRSQNMHGSKAKCRGCTAVVTAANGATRTCTTCHQSKGEGQFSPKEMTKEQPKCRQCVDAVFANKQSKSNRKNKSKNQPPTPKAESQGARPGEKT